MKISLRKGLEKLMSKSKRAVIELVAPFAKQAVKELRDLNSTIRTLTEMVESRKTVLRKLGAGIYTVDGEPVVEISAPGLRFDATTAKAVLTSEEYAEILVEKPDAERARKVLSGDRYAQCCNPTAAQVALS
jgi:hypothetical protein